LARDHALRAQPRQDARSSRSTAATPAAARHRFVSTRTLRTLALSRRLLANALTRPLNLLVAGVVTLAAFLLEPWLLFVAAASYVALVSITYFDEAEAHRVAEAQRRSRDS
jgi:ABC-type protease/lipase transport system fused ATPase/permease subunit